MTCTSNFEHANASLRTAKYSFCGNVQVFQKSFTKESKKEKKTLLNRKQLSRTITHKQDKTEAK